MEKSSTKFDRELNEMKKSSTRFDRELNEIAFFKTHEYLLPFVGNKYREGGVLHIGASHYFKLNDIEEAQRQRAEQILREWFNTSDNDVVNMRVDFLKTARKPITGKDTHKSTFGDWVNTRGIIEAFGDNNNYREKNRAIYREFLKAAYNKNSSGELKDTEGYAPFAYMNFFQKPARNTGTEPDDCSYKIVAQVIEKLRPKYIIVTSAIAGKQFQKRLSAVSDCEIRYYPHPSAFRYWKERTAELRNFFAELRKKGVF